MKLNYNRTRTITTADLYDACDPPLTFEVRSRPDQSWAILYNDFTEQGGESAETARALIAMTFLTVSDEDNKYPLDHVDHVQGLQDAIEASNPGYGEEFICNLAWAFGNNHYANINRRLGKSLASLAQSNGSDKAKAPVVAS